MRIFIRCHLMSSPVHIEVKNLELAYGSYVVMRDLNFEVKRGTVMIIMGGSGCGKSTLLKHMIGLLNASKGDILYDGKSFVHASEEERKSMLRRFGVLYQNGALWSGLTLAENVALPLEEYTRYTKREIADLVSLKLALVGLRGFEEYYPSAISGGMRKRAALARALALDPEILFLDEPSAGLDPITSKRLDDLILELRDSLKATFVVVTHERDSIFSIADDSIFLDVTTRTISARGNPNDLRSNPPNENVATFLNRGSPSLASQTIKS